MSAWRALMPPRVSAAPPRLFPWQGSTRKLGLVRRSLRSLASSVSTFGEQDTGSSAQRMGGQATVGALRR